MWLVTSRSRRDIISSMNIQEDLKGRISGDVESDDKTLEFYSHDASLFELRPEVVAFPKNVEDIKAIVKYVVENKPVNPALSVTARSQGTDMSGAAINDSIIMDTNRYMNKIWDVTPESAWTQPGVKYRDFEVETLKAGVYMPSYPASRELAGMGGIVNNNSGGERSLTFGKTAKYVNELKMVLADGNEYTIKPLNKQELVQKMSQGDYEGNLYKQLFDLIEANYDMIKAAQPHVSKDSTGYHIWDVWDRETGIFDLTKLFVGAQGTLGLMSEAKLRLVPKEKYSGTLVCYMRNIDNLGEVIPAVLSRNPLTFECFDDATLWLSFKFVFAFIPRLGLWEWLKMCLGLIPDGLAIGLGVPKMILLIEFAGETQEDVTKQILDAHHDLKRFKNFTYLEDDTTIKKSRKFWLMRRESFNLLRSKVKDKHTAPFIDDLIVPPANLAEFLPKLRVILKKYKFLATIAGHLGDGNFHIIPLMDIEKQSEREKLEPAQKEVNELVLKYGGSISGEHNDGMVRGPWLEAQYGPEFLAVLRQAKYIFDPENIFNPHKKTDATWDYSFAHIRKRF